MNEKYPNWIINDERTYRMIENILFNIKCIQKDLRANGKTHKSYVYEKLSKAKWDLDILVKEASEINEL